MTADRTMVMERVVDAPVKTVWQAWVDPEALPLWWGPNGYTCRTTRIDLRTGGEWVFDMIGPDGTIHPNHHQISLHDPEKQIAYSLHFGENGPKHADATVVFTDLGDKTKITMSMVFTTREEYEGAKAFGAYELGLETLDKMAAFVA